MRILPQLEKMEEMIHVGYILHFADKENKA